MLDLYLHTSSKGPVAYVGDTSRVQSSAFWNSRVCEYHLPSRVSPHLFISPRFPCPPLRPRNNPPSTSFNEFSIVSRLTSPGETRISRFRLFAWFVDARVKPTAPTNWFADHNERPKHDNSSLSFFNSGAGIISLDRKLLRNNKFVICLAWVVPKYILKTEKILQFLGKKILDVRGARLSMWEGGLRGVCITRLVPRRGVVFLFRL